MREPPNSWWALVRPGVMFVALVFFGIGMAAALFHWSTFWRGLIGGSLLGVAITLCLEEVRTAKKEWELRRSLYTMRSQGAILSDMISEDALPRIRTAVRLGSLAQLVLPGSLESDELQHYVEEFVTCAARLGVLDVCLSLDFGPNFAHAYGQLYEALTNTSDSEILAAFSIGYDIGCMMGFFEALVELRNNRQLLLDFGERLTSNVERLSTLDRFGLDSHFRTFVRENVRSTAT